MLKKVFSHTLIYGLAPIIPKVAGILSLPLITRYLSEYDYGVYGIINSYVGLLSALSMLGLNVCIVNAFYHNRGTYKWIWRQLYGFLTLWMLVYAAFQILLLNFILPETVQAHKVAIVALIVLPIVAFGPIANIGMVYYQLTSQPLQIALRTVISGILTVVANIVTICYFKMGYMGWLVSNCIASLFLNLSFWYPLNFKIGIKPIFNFKWKYLKKYLKVSLPLIPHYYSPFLLEASDKVVMKEYKVNTEDIGKYSLASSFGTYVSFLGQAVGTAVTPMMMGLYKRGEFRQARNLVFIGQFFFLLLTFTASLWLKDIFSWLIRNETLRGTYPLAIVLIMAFNYRIMYLGAINLLFFYEKTKRLWKITFLSGILSVILNIITIPNFGYKVSVINTFIALMFTGYSGYFLKDFKLVNTVKFYPILWLIATIVATALAFFCADITVGAKIILSVALWTTSLVLLFKSGFMKMIKTVEV